MITPVLTDRYKNHHSYSPLMVPSPNTSVHDGIACLHRPIGKQWDSDAMAGRPSQTYPPQHKGQDRRQRYPFSLVTMLTGNKLTKPLETFHVAEVAATNRDGAFLRPHMAVLAVQAVDARRRVMEQLGLLVRRAAGG
jgi:hypothetical protein